MKKKWHNRIAKLYLSDEYISSYLVLKFSDKGGFWKRLVQPGQYRKKPANQLTDSYLRSVGSWHGQSSLDFFEEAGSTYFRRYDTHIFTGEISIRDEGEYKISNGELLYRSSKFPQKLPSQLQMTDHHVEYTELLTFGGRSFYNTASLVPEGSQRVYEGIPISTLRKRGHITHEARSWYIPAPDAQEQDPLSDGAELMIVGKTKQTMEVHGMSMHFFLVRHLNSEAYHRWVVEDYIEFE